MMQQKEPLDHDRHVSPSFKNAIRHPPCVALLVHEGVPANAADSVRDPIIVAIDVLVAYAVAKGLNESNGEKLAQQMAEASLTESMDLECRCLPARFLPQSSLPAYPSLPRWFPRFLTHQYRLFWLHATLQGLPILWSFFQSISAFFPSSLFFFPLSTDLARTGISSGHMYSRLSLFSPRG